MVADAKTRKRRKRVCERYVQRGFMALPSRLPFKWNEGQHDGAKWEDGDIAERCHHDNAALEASRSVDGMPE